MTTFENKKKVFYYFFISLISAIFLACNAMPSAISFCILFLFNNLHNAVTHKQLRSAVKIFVYLIFLFYSEHVYTLHFKIANNIFSQFESSNINPFMVFYNLDAE